MHHCKIEKNPKHLKLKSLCAKNICASNGKITNLNSTNITTDNLTATTSNISNLNVDYLYLNGVNLNCMLSKPGQKETETVFDSVVSNSTTVSTGFTFPQTTINVVSTAGFASYGIFYVESTDGLQPVKYDGLTPTSFTNVTTGSGSVLTGAEITQDLPIRNHNIDEVVYNALICNSQSELFALKERLAEGRTAIQNFYNDNDCNFCGPTGPVGIKIHGYMTVPLLSLSSCGVSGGTGANAPFTTTQILKSVNYSLDVEYDIEKVKSVQPRVVSILCQLAYIDPTNIDEGDTGITGPCTIPNGNCGFPNCGPVYLTELEVSNKQYTPTLDLVYGEAFDAVVQIPSFLATLATMAMPDTDNSAAVQIVVYSEEGLTIWPESQTRGGDSNVDCGNNCKFGFTADTSGTTPICSTVSSSNVTCRCGSDVNGRPSGNPLCVTIVSSFTAVPTTGSAPLTVQFNNTSIYPALADASFIGTIVGNTLTVSQVKGTIAINQFLQSNTPGNTLLPFTYIISGSGTTWQVNLNQNITDLSMIAFANSSAYPVTFSWDFGDGTASSDVNPSHTYNTAGTYNVVLSVVQPKKPGSNCDCTPFNFTSTSNTTITVS